MEDYKAGKSIRPSGTPVFKGNATDEKLIKAEKSHSGGIKT